MITAVPISFSLISVSPCLRERSFLRRSSQHTCLARRSQTSKSFWFLTKAQRHGGVITAVPISFSFISVSPWLRERSFLRTNETVQRPGPLLSRDFKITSVSEFQDLPQSSQRAKRSEVRSQKSETRMMKIFSSVL